MSHEKPGQDAARLSPDEQRSLDEIQAVLEADDKSMARRMRRGQSKRAHHSGKLALLLVVAGFILTLASFTRSLAVATVGYLLMVYGCWILYKAVFSKDRDVVIARLNAWWGSQQQKVAARVSVRKKHPEG